MITNLNLACCAGTEMDLSADEDPLESGLTLHPSPQRQPTLDIDCWGTWTLSSQQQATQVAGTQPAPQSGAQQAGQSSGAEGILEVVAQQGFPQLCMRSLAAHVAELAQLLKV